METNKKGQINALSGMGIGLITFAIVIAIGMVVLTNFGNSQATCSGDVITYGIAINETGHVNSTPYTFVESSRKGFANIKIIAIQNVTEGKSGLYLDAANWTLSSTSIRNSTICPNDWYRANITYSYNWTNTHTWNSTAQACLNDSLGDSVTSISQTWTTVNYLNQNLSTTGLAGWVPALIAVMVGMLLLGFFAMGKGKRNY